MRILYLHQFDLNFAGGSGVTLRALSLGLAELGHSVEVVSARHPDQYGCTSYALPFDFTLTFGPEKRPGERTLDELDDATLEGMASRAAEAVAARIEAGGPRPELVLVNHLNLMALVAARLHERFGLPYRLLSHGTDTKLLLSDERYVRLFGAAARRAERIFPISGFVAREVKALFGDVPVEVLGGAVDARLFYPPTLPTAPGKVVTYVGRLVTEKGLWPLIHAVEALGEDVELRLVGEGPLRPALEAYLARSPLGRRAALLGYVPPSELRAELLRAAVVAVPSLWQEPLGLVVLEARACGVPVVASAVGGIPEMIHDGVDGLLVPPGDVGLLAAALRRALDDDELRAGLWQRRAPPPTFSELGRRVVA